MADSPLERKISNQERKISSAAEKRSALFSVHHPSIDRKVSNVTSALQGLQVTPDNLLLREARSPSVGVNDTVPNPQVPKKFINTWRQACDKTKERTKDLIKRWRTLPEGSSPSYTPDDSKNPSSWSQSWGWELDSGSQDATAEMTSDESQQQKQQQEQEMWWRCRMYPGQTPPPLIPLALEQRAKLAQLYNTLLDTDSDGLVSADDFHSLAERLRQFAGWNEQGPHACMLREVIAGLLEAFLHSLHTPTLEETDSPTNPSPVHNGNSSLGLFLGLDDWLAEWSKLLHGVRSLTDLPLWLQYFPKILFAAINRTSTGVIASDELRYFYTSFLGFDSRKVDEAMATAYDAMTANGDHLLNTSTYQLVFANFLLGRNPNGPGQFVFGPFGDPSRQVDDCMFPVDYSALNSLPEDLEEYSPGKKSNRRSVIV